MLLIHFEKIEPIEISIKLLIGLVGILTNSMVKSLSLFSAVHTHTHNELYLFKLKAGHKINKTAT